MEWSFAWLKAMILANGLRILIVIAAAWFCMLITRKSIDSLAKRLISRAVNREEIETKKRLETLSQLGRTVTMFSIVIVAAMVVLDQMGIKLGPVLAAAGIVGLAVGFGAQSLVKDVISGMFILIENQFNIGDWIDAGGVSGIVERSNLRVTVLRDVDGKVHFVPNGQITVVSNYTKEWSQAVLNIGIAYREDVDHVIEVLKEVGKGLRDDPLFGSKILEPVKVLGVQGFDDSAVTIRVTIKTKPLEQWGIAREYRKRVKRAFDEKGIEIPFPHRTVYMGVPKEGTAPPVNVHLEKPDEAEAESLG